MLVIGLTHGAGTDKLLVFSQVVLALQLPFAVVPLVKFTGSRRRMGPFVSGPVLKTLAWLVAGILLALNGKLAIEQIMEWRTGAGAYAWVVTGIAVPLAAALVLLLLWMVIKPERDESAAPAVSADEVVAAATSLQRRVRRVGAALEASAGDAAPLAEAIAIAKSHGAELVLMHVVEGVGGQWHGPAADDAERRADEVYMRDLASRLRVEVAGTGIVGVRSVLGYGPVARALVRLSQEEEIDVLITGCTGIGGCRM